MLTVHAESSSEWVRLNDSALLKSFVVAFVSPSDSVGAITLSCFTNAMAPYMSVERAHRSYGPVNKDTLVGRLSKSERGMLRTGLVKSEQWTQLPTEGLYQVLISEVLDDGRTYPLERGAARAFTVTAVLDLGLRMLESPRGRDGKSLLLITPTALSHHVQPLLTIGLSAALASLARKAICIWRERPVPGPPCEPSSVDVPSAVDDFVRCVRYRFPVVKLDDRNGFCHEGELTKSLCSWVDEYSTLEKFEFNPKEAAVLHLNWHVRQQTKQLHPSCMHRELTPHRSWSRSSTGPGSRPTSPAATAGTTSRWPRRCGSTASSSTSPPWSPTISATSSSTSCASTRGWRTR